MVIPCLVRGGYAAAFKYRCGSRSPVATGPYSAIGRYIWRNPKFSRSQATVILRIGTSRGHGRTSPLRAPDANHGRCGCFHCKWKHPHALVSVWSSRVGLLPPWREICSSRHRRQRRLLVPVAQNLSCFCLSCAFALCCMSSLLVIAVLDRHCGDASRMSKRPTSWRVSSVRTPQWNAAYN